MGNFKDFDLDLQTEKVNEVGGNEKASTFICSYISSKTVDLTIAAITSATKTEYTPKCSASCHNCARK